MALEDVLSVETNIKGPAQLAVKLAKASKRKENPILDAMLVTRDSAGDLGVAWTTMGTGEISEMMHYVEIVVQESLREAWVGEEYMEDDGDDDDGDEDESA